MKLKKGEAKDRMMKKAKGDNRGRRVNCCKIKIEIDNWL